MDMVYGSDGVRQRVPEATLAPVAVKPPRGLIDAAALPQHSAAGTIRR